MVRRQDIFSAALAALALSMLSWDARAELVTLRFTEGNFVHQSVIAPGKFLEVCGKLKKDQKIAWRFTGSAPTDFNIHYHVGKDVVYPEQRKAVGDADGALTVPLDQDFCWMWSNKSPQPVQVDVQLKEAGVAPGKPN